MKHFALLGALGLLCAGSGCQTAPPYPTGLPDPKPTGKAAVVKRNQDPISEETREHASRLREAQVDALMERPDVKPIVTEYDRKLGRDAFRSELVRRAREAWELRKEDLPPAMALLEIMVTDPIAEAIARDKGQSFRLMAGLTSRKVQDLFGSPKQAEAIRGMTRSLKTGEKKVVTFSEWTYEARPCKALSGNRFMSCKLLFDNDLVLFEQKNVDPKYLDLSSPWQSSDPLPPEMAH